MTLLTVVIGVLLMSILGANRRRASRDREVQARFAAANALAEVSRAQADATSRRMQATFAAVTDGIAIFDAHLYLVEWNGLFPEHSGVNASFIRTGMPMEDVLRMQAEAGYFGPVTMWRRKWSAGRRCCAPAISAPARPSTPTTG